MQDEATGAYDQPTGAEDETIGAQARHRYFAEKPMLSKPTERLPLGEVGRRPKATVSAPDGMVRIPPVMGVMHDGSEKRVPPATVTYHRHQVPHSWIVDPEQETLLVYRWAAEGYVEVLVAERGDEVRPEPFEAVPLMVGVLFGDDDDESA